MEHALAVPVPAVSAPHHRVGYQPELDGIRALGILLVVLFHASVHFRGGWIGVDLFFVLSGFLITRLLTEEQQARGRIDLKAFYIRRLLRLAPAFACMLLAFSAWALAFSSDPRRNLLDAAFSGAYVMNWTNAFGITASKPLVHTWSLAGEEQFYLLWPLALILLAGRNRLAWALGLAASSMCWRIALVLNGGHWVRTYYPLDTRSDGLLIGAALALMPVPPWFARRATQLVPIPLCALMAITLGLDIQSTLARTVGIDLAVLLSAWLVVAAMEPGWFHRLLSTGPMTYTGRISYGWYLWHLPILAIGGGMLPQARGVDLMLALASYPVAMASHRWVELPFVRLKRRFTPPLPNPAAQPHLTAGAGSAS